MCLNEQTVSAHNSFWVEKHVCARSLTKVEPWNEEVTLRGGGGRRRERNGGSDFQENKSQKYRAPPFKLRNYFSELFAHRSAAEIFYLRVHYLLSGRVYR